jgi:hypothetical protein
MMTAFDAIRVINWLNQHGAGEATGSGGEFIAPLSTPSGGSGGESIESSELGASSNLVIGPLPSVTTTRSATVKESPRVSSQQNDSNLLYLTAVDQLMAAGNQDDDHSAAHSEEESLSDWLSFGGRLRGPSTAKNR